MTFFTAYNCSSNLSFTLNTLPKPPEPIGANSSKVVLYLFNEYSSEIFSLKLSVFKQKIFNKK